MRRLQQMVEAAIPHRLHCVGQIYVKNSTSEQFAWKTFPPDLDLQNNEIFKDVRLDLGMSW